VKFGRFAALNEFAIKKIDVKVEKYSPCEKYFTINNSGIESTKYLAYSVLTARAQKLKNLLFARVLKSFKNAFILK